MTENQKLREALQKIIEIKNKTEGSDWEEIEEAREIARQALALPTAGHIPEVGQMVADHLPNAGKMTSGLNQSETDASASVYGLTAAPVGELPELPLPTSIPGFYDIEARKRCVYTADQMRAYARAALSAGDAVDAQRTPLTVLQYNAIPELCAIPPSLYESVVRAIERAHGIDAAMRKGQL